MRRVAAALLMTAASIAHAQEDDPYLWLEDVTSERSMAWVKEQDAVSQPLLEGKPAFKALHERLLAIYNSRSRIPAVKKRGEWLYNFWQDAANPRGLWRRTSMAEYRKADPAWETVLDLDKLSADEKQTWVFKGAECLYPKYERCLVSLSRGGADAVEVREFDVPSRQFVKDGFNSPESKGRLAWRDGDIVYAARDFGPGTMSASGYPRTLREWKRGTPIEQAVQVHEALATDVGIEAWTDNEPKRKYERMRRTIDTRLGQEFLYVRGHWILIEAPQDADVATFNDLMVVRLRSDWKPFGNVTYKAGSLIACNVDRFVSGRRDEFRLIYEPGERASLQSYTVTKNFLLLDVLDNVKARVIEARLVARNWQLREVAVPKAASIDVTAVDRDESDDYWMTVTSFTEPTTLYLAHAGSDKREKVKSLPAFFDAKGLAVTQHEATSRDGTRVPYFVVMRRGTKLDGKNPTILYGYGGFEISMMPNYSGTIGAGWLEKGGVWVLANLRGGGEFGPQWHLSARREGRQKAHDDFIAVAEDLIKRKVSSPRHLGIMGGSQGGLLVGAAFTQRPELFRAVVSTVPLLDMKRYHKLLAGASWMGEYGNPDDPADWAFISKYSPYQNVFKDRKYPKVFFTTSTRDDRVHPGHARKMFARMKEQGHDVLYFEYIEGGHAAGALPAQQAYSWALIYTFFATELR